MNDDGHDSRHRHDDATSGAHGTGHDDPVVEWALHERLRGETPPDLTAAVRARLASEPAVADAAADSVGAGRGQRLVMAALLLLGAAVVVGVAAWPRERASATVPDPGEPQDRRAEPKPVAVDMLTDVDALPADTRAVEAVAVHDVKLAELEQLRDLEVLVIRDPSREAFGLSPKMSTPRQHWLVTGAAWVTIAKLSKLRRLELSGIELAAFHGADAARVATDAFALLERLPLLESLTLRCCDTPDAFLAGLPRLRALRHLDLSFNHGFEEEGVDAIVQCRSLRSLSLRGCQQLHDRVLAKVAALPELEELDLSAIDGINWQVGPDTPLPPPVAALRDRARKLADRLGMGPGAQTFTALGATRRLRSLDVSGGHWRSQQLALLGGAFVDDGRDGAILRATGGQFDGSAFVASLPKSLERLEVCGDYGDDFCTAVAAHLPNLRHLNLAACGRIRDPGIATLAAMPSLRALDLRQMRGLTAACIDTLAKAAHVEELDLRHNDFVTAEHVVRLRMTLPRIRSLQTSVPQDAIAAVPRTASAVRVRQPAAIGQLAAGVLCVDANLEPGMLAALGTRPALERLTLRPAGADRAPDGVEVRPGAFDAIVTAELAELAKLPHLRSLELVGLRGLLPDAFAALGRFTTLQELRLQEMVLSDTAIRDLALMPLRSLTLRLCVMRVDAPRSLAAMQSLRELVIDGVAPLTSSSLAELAKLRQLERLTLANGRRTTHVDQQGFTTAILRPGAGWGVDTSVLEALAGMRSLRSLDITGATIESKGLRALHGLATLRHLVGVPGSRALLVHLPPQLQELELVKEDVDVDFGEALAVATPALVRMDFTDHPRLGVDALASLRHVRSLRHLDLSGCERMTGAAAAALLGMPWLETLVLRNVPALGTAELAKLRTLPNLKVLETEKGREVLRR